MSTTTKHERNVAKAKARSQRNTAATKRTTAQQRRVVRRAEMRANNTLPPKKERGFTKLGRKPRYVTTRELAEKMSVESLQVLCLGLGAKFNSKTRKPALVDLVAGPKEES